MSKPLPQDEDPEIFSWASAQSAYPKEPSSALCLPKHALLEPLDRYVTFHTMDSSPTSSTVSDKFNPLASFCYIISGKGTLTSQSLSGQTIPVIPGTVIALAEDNDASIDHVENIVMLRIHVRSITMSETPQVIHPKMRPTLLKSTLARLLLGQNRLVYFEIGSMQEIFIPAAKTSNVLLIVEDGTIFFTFRGVIKPLSAGQAVFVPPAYNTTIKGMESKITKVIGLYFVNEV